jgi:hypothetical protein
MKGAIKILGGVIPEEMIIYFNYISLFIMFASQLINQPKTPRLLKLIFSSH